jgi:phospholipid transport system substrate-binding protein
MGAPRSIVAVAALGLGALLVPPAWAGEPAEQLSAHIDQVLKLLGDPELKLPAKAQERREAIQRFAADILDFEELARRSLGRHWEARTPAEREEFVQLFGEFVGRVLVSKLDRYNGEKVVIVGDAPEGAHDDEATVKTLVAARVGAIPVDYEMVRRGDRWRVGDIVISGMSLARNFRSQFDHVIRRASYEQLVQQVRDKQ